MFIHAALQTSFLLEQLRVDVQVVAISNSRSMLLSRSPLQGTDWQAALSSQARTGQKQLHSTQACFTVVI